MRIQKVEAWPVSIPYATSFGVSRGGAPASEHVVVRIEAEGGQVGLGEAAPSPFYSYENQDTVLSLVRGPIASRLVGEDARALSLRMADVADAVLGHPFARAAVEVALYDLVARGLGLPFYQLLGGCMRQRIPVAMPLGIDTIGATAEKAASYVAQGFRTLKLKVGRDPLNDLDRLRVCTRCCWNRYFPPGGRKSRLHILRCARMFPQDGGL